MTRVSERLLVQQAGEDVVILDETTAAEVVVRADELERVIGALSYFSPTWELDIFVQQDHRMAGLDRLVEYFTLQLGSAVEVLRHLGPSTPEDIEVLYERAVVILNHALTEGQAMFEELKSA